MGEVDLGEGEEGAAASKQKLTLGYSDYWGYGEAVNLQAETECGLGLAMWDGQPLILNDCKLMRFNHFTGRGPQDKVQLNFAGDFAEQPRILALDDMPWANGLAAIVEDTREGVTSRHLGFIRMDTGEVHRIGSAAADARGIAVKFKGFESEPKWPLRVMPH